MNEQIPPFKPNPAGCRLYGHIYQLWSVGLVDGELELGCARCRQHWPFITPEKHAAMLEALKGLVDWIGDSPVKPECLEVALRALALAEKGDA